MFTREIISEIAAVARTLGIETEALLAVAEVESAGQAYARVDGRDEPLIRFEGHYFDQRLSATNQAKARALGLSAPAAGVVANPRTQEARWRLLERAAAIDRKAAYESVSWGLGQVMGAHWAWLGYAHVDALVAEARSGVGGQVRLMARYIDKAGLSPSLRERDWAAFARGYNGPNYRQNGYHTKIASAYQRYRDTVSPMVAVPSATRPADAAQSGARSPLHRSRFRANRRNRKPPLPVCGAG
ncbi:N-acetylmuramidase family protein [Mesorhizobium sp. KR1-2]|uniref:N-acetylmuramidase family protein n=1 Tax=Mesorhizobium sp. KR1-2 TaxID=3156609 RepID=UPI0032B4C040